MAKFLYTPPTADDPEEVFVFGQKWTAKKAATLKDESWLTVMMGHPHFERADSDSPAAQQPSAPVPKPAVPAPAAKPAVVTSSTQI